MIFMYQPWYYDVIASCYLGQRTLGGIIFSHWVHLKLGRRFHAHWKVYFDRDGIAPLTEIMITSVNYCWNGNKCHEMKWNVMSGKRDDKSLDLWFKSISFIFISYSVPSGQERWHGPRPVVHIQPQSYLFHILFCQDKRDDMVLSLWFTYNLNHIYFLSCSVRTIETTWLLVWGLHPLRWERILSIGWQVLVQLWCLVWLWLVSWLSRQYHTT